MEFIDCGVAGSSRAMPKASWESLGLAEPWTSTLRSLAGTDGPRPVQVEAFAMSRILESRRNLFVSAPTNAGKSLVGISVLLDSIRQGGRAVLLEPLRALAREKADDLESHRAYLSEALGCNLEIKLTTGDYRLADEHFTDPPPKTGQLIIATPERFDAILRNPISQDWIDTITSVCVDEAHLIGSPRRGATLEYVVTSLLSRSRPPRFTLLSASVGQTERIQSWLSPCDVVRVTERYPALHKVIATLSEQEDSETAIVELVEQALQLEDSMVMVFVYQTSSTVTLCRRLNERLRGLLGAKGALPYHAQMSTQQRELTRTAVDQRNSRCIVATTALALGVNLPASHVIVRDVTFPGCGPLPITEILQMAGRAGRGNRPGTATVLLRSADPWSAAELTRQFRDEPLPEIGSSFDRVIGGPSQSNDSMAIPRLASLLALQLDRHRDVGATTTDLKSFFLSSLGGGKIVRLVDTGLEWLTAPSQLIAYRNETGRYQLTTLGLKAVRSTLPLEIAAGIGQLIRDMLHSDAEDRWLSQWAPLDNLLILECLSARSPSLRRFNKSLPDQLETWMEAHPTETPVTYREWIRGDRGTSKADQFFGSLGRILDQEAARKAAMLATLRAIVLKERGHGVPILELERRWELTNLVGQEEQWRDQVLWLLAALRPLFDIRCFYYCLREECQADDRRIERVRERLRTMEHQAYGLSEHLKYCSALGGLLRSMQRLKRGGVGIKTIRRLEEAGISSLATLASLSQDDLQNLGISSKRAATIQSYLRARAGY